MIILFIPLWIAKSSWLAFLQYVKDTLGSNPPEKVTMKKASITGICITTFFYLCCGGFGYAAFGNSTPGNFLTGFGFYEPYWLIDFANACVVLHLIGAYQVFVSLMRTSSKWSFWHRDISNWSDVALISVLLLIDLLNSRKCLTAKPWLGIQSATVCKFWAMDQGEVSKQ